MKDSSVGSSKLKSSVVGFVPRKIPQLNRHSDYLSGTCRALTRTSGSLEARQQQQHIFIPSTQTVSNQNEDVL